jgi:RimK family alpha-L-glutamate ligase
VRIAILSRGDGWHARDLIRAAAEQGHTAELLDFRTLSTDTPLASYDAVIVRTMPAGSLEQIVFRMDLLHAAADAGVRVLNPPRAVETCVDKFLTNVRLQQVGLPVPETVVCQRADDALTAFERLGGDVVVKPLFGSEGRGMVRVTDRELAWRTFHAIEQTRSVLYLQRFVTHPGWDVRVLVLNDIIIGAMRRIAHGDWRTNVAQGGSAEKCNIGDAESSLALRSTAATGAVFAGVDLIQDDRGRWLVIEVNAVPGWRAFTPVCGIDVASCVSRFIAGEDCR